MHNDRYNKQPAEKCISRFLVMLSCKRQLVDLVRNTSTLEKYKYTSCLSHLIFIHVRFVANFFFKWILALCKRRFEGRTAQSLRENVETKNPYYMSVVYGTDVHSM